MAFTIGAAEFPARRLEPGLYVVATPIGNLRDITIRALETLASADLVACEDTRVTGKLLNHFAIRAKLQAYHEHNAEESGRRLLERLEAGGTVALASDAGTPLVSDPGGRLVAEARRRGIAVWPVPGPSAPVAAISASGLPSEAFLFAGFLPQKEAARRKRLAEFAATPATLAFFESPNRLARALHSIAAEYGPDREVAICREITKLHEEMVRGTAAALAERYDGAEVKGEIVLLVAPPAQAEQPEDPDRLLTELLARMSVSEAAAEAARLTGAGKRDLYQRALAIAARERER